MANILISVYPASIETSDHVANHLGPNFENITLDRLISLKGIAALFKSSDVVLFSNGPLSSPYEPALVVLSALNVRARIWFVFEDQTIRRIKLSEITGAIFALAFASIISILNFIRYSATAAYMSLAPRVCFTAYSPTRLMIHIQGILWRSGGATGGAPSHTAGIANAFREDNFDVILAASQKPDCIRKDIEYVDVPPPSIFLYPAELDLINFHFESTRCSKSALQHRNPDFVYARLAPFNFSAVLISRWKKCPLIVEYNGSEVWISQNWNDRKLKLNWLAFMMEKIILKHAHLVIAISAPLQKELVDRGVPKDRTVLVPNGVDLSAYDVLGKSASKDRVLRDNFAFPPSSFVVTFVASFGPWHGAEILAKAIVKLVNDQPSLVQEKYLRFLFVGDGSRRRATQEIILRAGHKNIAHFTGNIDATRIPEILMASDILVSPHDIPENSRIFFGSPTKLYEYLAAGRPIIASDVGQISEVMSKSPTYKSAGSRIEINDDICGLRIPSGDESILAEAILTIINMPESSRIKMGKNARKLAEDHHSWKARISKIQHILEKIHQAK